MNELELKMNSNMRPRNLDYIERVLAQAEQWIDGLTQGGDPFRDLWGLFQRAFYSRVGGSLQPFAIYLPHDYNGKEALRLLALLHGAGGDQWEILQSAANPDGHSIYASALEHEPDKPRFILCAPVARGAASFQYLAEMDVLQMLDEVQHDYRIDKERRGYTWAVGSWEAQGPGP